MQTGVSVPGAPREPVSEDCLTLSIWTPAKSREQKLPVMVWIPGGGFTQESASMPLYWGDALATRGVIVVTINYRVGLLGFLAHPELSRESGHHSSGNYGLLDQIAALAWIKRNVAAFGGDPERVTIWGQSAGSMSVSLLMASPLARGLFQRAIGQSGGYFVPPAATRSPEGLFLKGAEEQGVRLASDLGAKSLEALRKLEPEQFLKDGNAGTMHPIIDGYVVPEEPYAAFAAGRQNDVPILIGSNADEARPLIAGNDVRLATFAEDIGQVFGQQGRPLSGRGVPEDLSRHDRPGSARGSGRVRARSAVWLGYVDVGTDAGEDGTSQGVLLLLRTFATVSTGQFLRRLGGRTLGRVALCVRPSEPGAVGVE